MRLHAVLALALLAGCSPPSGPSDKQSPPDNSGTNNVSENNVSTADIGLGADVDTVAVPDMPAVFGNIPDAITSQGAEFAGRLAAGESVTLDLTVFQADRVTMWLRQTGGTSWDPSINVWRDGSSDPLVWGNPQGNEDASIPFRSGELDDGFEFWFSDTYALELENRGETPGEFTFTLECRGGPCAITGGDADVDGILDDADACPYNPADCGADAYAGLSDGALEDAIRTDHAAHVVMNYVEARVHMFAWIDKDGGEVECIYTGDRVMTDEIPDPSLMNTEHGWPQSRSGGDTASESDLHHLYPTNPDANMERASLYFGEVTQPEWERGGSARGRNAAGDTVFEPRDRQKGDLARTLFYYAVIYDVDMRNEEEVVLRQWNVADPPDERELRRHQSIANVQRSRNPFVDDPSLADRISAY